MSQQISDDFEQQRHFLEVIAHEAQTPLAIISLSLETLIQGDHLKEDDFNQIETIQATIDKLSSTNKKLLLISKIDNDQFSDKKSIEFSRLIEQQIQFFRPLTEMKRVTVTINKEAALFINMNELLAEILINDIIQNALRYNIEGGEIIISIDSGSFTLINSGSKTAIPSYIFENLINKSLHPDSNGLGFNIISSILDRSNLQLNYRFDELHYFRVSKVN